MYPMSSDHFLLRLLSTAPKILNDNQGVLTLSLFVLTLLFGWISGIFKTLRRKPDLKISTLLGPTFACVFGTGKKYNGYDTHCTSIALYLKISNVSMSPTTITHIKVEYRQNLFPKNIVNLLLKRVKWFYIDQQSIAISDFQASIGENIKLYPFLFQKSAVSGESASTYLEPGRSTNGVAYFEQPECWGGYFPRSRNFRTKVKIVIVDSFGRRYRHVTTIDRVTLANAREYNPQFGMTQAQLHGWKDLIELPLDKHGNLKPPKH